MNLLAFDTASPTPAIALLWSGRIFEESLPADRHASEQLLPGIARVLECAQASLPGCERIAVCSGPGSFTGVRVGLATAWGLGRTLGLPVEGIPTLEALAEGARAPGVDRVAAALDAGRGDAVVQLFAIGPQDPRARALSSILRLPLGQALTLWPDEEFVALPAGLLGRRGRAVVRTPAQSAALAVARAPHVQAAPLSTAIYARASAAEEKLGAA